MDVSIQIVDIKTVKQNPNNPRVIKNHNFKKLVQSIIDFPEMLNIRPIVVDGNMVAIGGNKRLLAAIKAGLKEIPIINASELSEEKQREFLIKDNVSSGEWNFDELANTWDEKDLSFWGLDIPDITVSGSEKKSKTTEEEHSKRMFYAFSTCNKILKTNSINYFALFRNNDMDLEELKSKKENIDIFVYPVLKYLIDNNLKNVIIAPAGSRAEKYGFHFVTELMNQVSKMSDICIHNVFKNKKNKIELDADYDIKNDSVIFDDIITRGTTLKKLNSLTGITKNLILITNH